MTVQRWFPLLLVLAVVAVLPASASADDLPPTLSDITITPGSVDVGTAPADVTISVHAVDSDGVDFVSAGSGAFPAEAGWELSLVSGTIFDGIWQVTVEVPTWIAPGDYSVGVWAEGAPVNDISIPDAATLHVDSNVDNVNPVVESVSAEPETVDVTGGAGQVTVAAHLTDNRAIDDQDTSVTLLGETKSLVLDSGTLQDGIWKATFDVPASTPAGDYTISVLAEDVGVNDTGGAGTLHVVSAAPTVDSEDPVVVDVTAEPSGSEQVTVLAHLTDNVAIDDVDTTVTLFGETKPLVLDSGTAQNGTWKAVFDIPDSTPPGNYPVSVLAEDTSVNTAGGSGTFRIPDITDPVITSVTLSETTLPTSDGPHAVTITIHVTDDKGVTGVDLSSSHEPGRGNQLGIVTLTRIGGTSTDGTWRGTIVLPGDAAVGDWVMTLVAGDGTNLAIDRESVRIRVTERAADQAPPQPEPEPEQPKSNSPVVLPPVVPVDRTAPQAAISAPRVSSAAVTAATSCSEACSIHTELRLGKVVLSRASKRLATAGRANLRLRLDAADRRRLRRAHGRKAVLRSTVTDAAGNRRVVTRRVSLH